MSKNLFVTLVALASVFALAQAGSLLHRPCTTDTPSRATEVSLSSPHFGDNTAKPTLKKGVPYTLVLSFKASTSTPTLTTKLAALIAGIEAPWNGVSPNTCNFLTEGSCPFVAGQTYTYTNVITAPSSSPAVSITILWRVMLTDGNEVCFELPAQIEN